MLILFVVGLYSEWYRDVEFDFTMGLIELKVTVGPYIHKKKKKKVKTFNHGRMLSNGSVVDGKKLNISSSDGELTMKSTLTPMFWKRYAGGVEAVPWNLSARSVVTISGRKDGTPALSLSAHTHTHTLQRCPDNAGNTRVDTQYNLPEYKHGLLTRWDWKGGQHLKKTRADTGKSV